MSSPIEDKNSHELVIDKQNKLALKEKEQKVSKWKGVKQTASSIAKRLEKM